MSWKTRAPFWFNCAAAVMTVVLGGIYLRAGEWDGALVSLVLLAALLQAMSYQRPKKRDETRGALAVALMDLDWHYGLDLAREMNVSLGELYQTLGEFERRGLVESSWEDGPRPRRRLYRLSQEAAP